MNEILTVTELVKLFLEVGVGWLVYLVIDAPLGKDVLKWVEPALTYVGLNESQQKRFWAIVWSLLFSSAVYVPAVLMGYLPQPENWLGGLLAASGVVYANSQIAHMVRDLGKDKAS